MQKTSKTKTELEKAENAAYITNHALACTAADLLSPFIGNYTQTYLGKRMEIGCAHDHSTPAPPAPAARKKGLFTSLTETEEAKEQNAGNYKRLQPAPHEHTHAAPTKSNLKHWWVGEIIGDFGAVPVTIAVDRFFPGFMSALRHVMEPVLSPLFRAGAKRSARIWAEEMHANAAARKEQENSIYEREMSHLPQALVWTVSATALNIAAQRISGNKGELSHLLTGKLAGSALSAGLVVGFRGIAPHKAYQWDQFTSRHIFEPATKLVTGAWQKRVEEEKAEAKSASI